MIELDALVHDANGLRPLPASVLRMLDLLTRDDWDLDAVVETASLDAALTARILRVANSAANGSVSPVTTLEESTMRLGAAAIVKLATGSAVRTYMASPDSTDDETGEQDLWRCSVATALAADRLVELSPHEIPREAFTVALLNDIGRIVLSRHLDRSRLDLLARAVAEGQRNPLEAEREILGVDHAELGALIAERWQLPGLIAESIRFHHTPMDALDPDVRTLCDVITVADAVAGVVARTSGKGEPTNAFDYAESCVRLEIEGTTFDTLCEEVGDRLESALADYE